MKYLFNQFDLRMKPVEKIETQSAFIWIDDEGILHLRIKDGAEIDLEEAKKCFEIYKALGCKKNKVFQLIEGGTFFTIDTDAQKYIAQQGKDYFHAAAIVNNSLAIRMLFNFFNKFFKQKVPFQMFPSRDKALNWLRRFNQTKNKRQPDSYML